MTRLEHDGRDPDSGHNRWVLHLLSLEASILSSLPDQVESLLAEPDSNRRVIGRLFPTCYADPAEQARHEKLLGAAMLDERRDLLAQVRSSLATAERDAKGMRLALDPVSMDLWLRFINDVRLIIATDLGIDRNLGDESIDLDHPEAAKYALLEYLSGLEAAFVEALSREF